MYGCGVRWTTVGVTQGDQVLYMCGLRNACVRDALVCTAVGACAAVWRRRVLAA